jgi:hypothetical protein
MDAAMWCKFTVEAKSIGNVFDPARVDASNFNKAVFKFRIAASMVGRR